EQVWEKEYGSCDRDVAQVRKATIAQQIIPAKNQAEEYALGARDGHQRERDQKIRRTRFIQRQRCGYQKNIDTRFHPEGGIKIADGGSDDGGEQRLPRA